MGRIVVVPYHLIYVSRATVEVDDGVLRSIRGRSVVNNERDGVTGLLLYGYGNFLQLLEGSVAVVTTLFDRIQQDPRHTDIRSVYFGQAPNRVYPEWSMGALNVGGAKADVSCERLASLLAKPATSFRERYIQTISVFEDFRAQLSERATTTSP